VGTPTSRLVVGKVTRAHGLSGEVSVIVLSSRPERFVPDSIVYAEDRMLTVDSVRSHQDRLLVRFREVSDRSSAEDLRGIVLTASPLGETGEDEIWVHEVVGAEVHEVSGCRVGSVVAVEANPAHDLLVLDTGALVPMVFVVSHVEGVVVVDPPPGLWDLVPPTVEE